MKHLVGTNNATCLVVGGFGFIGSHLVDELSSSGDYQKIIILDNFFLGNSKNIIQESSATKILPIRADGCDLSTLLEIIEKQRVNIVFNLGVLPLPHSLRYPYANAKTNYDLANTICESIRKNPDLYLIHCSTSEVYGSLKNSPMDENHQCTPETPYAASKLSADFLVQSYVKTFGIKAAIVRPFNNYGSRQNAYEYSGVFPLFAKAISQKRNLTILGSGVQTRDFVLVSDTARAINLIAHKTEYNGEIYNIGTEKETSILDLAVMLMEIYNLSPSVLEFKDQRIADVSRHCGSNKKLEDLTGFKPRKLSKDTVGEVIEKLIFEIEVNS